MRRLAVVCLVLLSSSCAGTHVVPVPGVDPSTLAWAAGIQAGAALCDSTDVWDVLSSFSSGLVEGGEGCP